MKVHKIKTEKRFSSRRRRCSKVRRDKKNCGPTGAVAFGFRALNSYFAGIPQSRGLEATLVYKF
jgi:hypothetical protein